MHVESWLFHNYTVVYAANSGGDWEFSSVDDSEIIQWFGITEIALNSTGVPFIAYHFSEATGPETADFFVRFASTEEFPVSALAVALLVGVAIGAIALALALVYYVHHRRLLRKANSP